MAYFIVETVEQLQKLPKADRCFIELIPLSEYSHPGLTTPCVLYYNDFEKGYIIPLTHSETFTVPVEEIQVFLDQIKTIYLLDLKKHSYYLNLPQAIDINFTILDTDGKIEGLQCNTAVHLDFYEKFKYSNVVNIYVPVSKHYEKCECLFDKVKKYIGLETNVEWQREYVEAYKWVEESGIAVDEKLFDKYFEPVWKERSLRNQTAYTSYNLYNTTSRPTNAFNGVNYLAFNKENTSRRAFIPKNDLFVELDFDGYHIRLVANLLDIEIPQDRSIHEYLGQEYFGKVELTEEEYQESKKITFRQMYNGVENRYKHIQLFQKLAEFTETLWKEYESVGYLLLPNGRRIHVENGNPQKILNYYVQCLETVNNVRKLGELRETLKDKQSKVVLVVYDSILVDYAAEDGIETLKNIKEVLENGNYRVKAKRGSNYDF